MFLRSVARGARVLRRRHAHGAAERPRQVSLVVKAARRSHRRRGFATHEQRPSALDAQVHLEGGRRLPDLLAESPHQLEAAEPCSSGELGEWHGLIPAFLQIRQRPADGCVLDTSTGTR